MDNAEHEYKQKDFFKHILFETPTCLHYLDSGESKFDGIIQLTQTNSI